MKKVASMLLMIHFLAMTPVYSMIPFDTVQCLSRLSIIGETSSGYASFASKVLLVLMQQRCSTRFWKGKGKIWIYALQIFCHIIHVSLRYYTRRRFSAIEPDWQKRYGFHNSFIFNLFAMDSHYLEMNYSKWQTQHKFDKILLQKLSL